MHRKQLPVQKECHLMGNYQDSGQAPEQPCIHTLNHIVRVKPTDRMVAVAINTIQEKCACVDVSSGTWVCHLPNRYQRD